MEAAYAAAKSNQLFIVETQSKRDQSKQIFVFYNNLDPFGFCYTFSLKGDWDPNEDQYGLFFLTDMRQSSLSYSIINKQELSAEVGSDDFAKAASLLERSNIAMRDRYKPNIGISTSRRWLDHPHKKILVWKAKLEDDKLENGSRITIPGHYLIQVPGDQIMNIKANSSLGIGREDEIAKGVIDSLLISQDSSCFFSILRQWLKE